MKTASSLAVLLLMSIAQPIRADDLPAKPYQIIPTDRYAFAPADREAWNALRQDVKAHGLRPLKPDELAIVGRIEQVIMKFPRFGSVLRVRAKDEAGRPIPGAVVWVSWKTPDTTEEYGHWIRDKINMPHSGELCLLFSRGGCMVSCCDDQATYYGRTRAVPAMLGTTLRLKTAFSERLKEEGGMWPFPATADGVRKLEWEDTWINGMEFILQKRGETTVLDYRTGSLETKKGKSTASLRYATGQTPGTKSNPAKLEEAAIPAAGQAKSPVFWAEVTDEPPPPLTEREQEWVKKGAVIPALPILKQIKWVASQDGDGFIPFIPESSNESRDNPIVRQMHLAPESGYQKELIWKVSGALPFANGLFYARIGGKYARCRFRVSPVSERSTYAQGQWKISVEMDVQPDGTTNLETGE